MARRQSDCLTKYLLNTYATPFQCVAGRGESLELGGFVVVVLFSDELDLDRSADFLIGEEVDFVEFEGFVPELSFLSSELVLVVLEEDLVELSF
ncbi:unnamed protein product [Microthlaspi erraticum]|uniref:Uncharacterized protein n=1 Tax=Microthlaspi erraticum TaxID=1685480 RepID=A0A6D2L0S1_9BRAS|nr:unnamed protein product [Microthlaspi erraticum]